MSTFRTAIVSLARRGRTVVLWSACLLVATLPSRLPAQEVCPKDALQADNDVWGLHSGDAALRSSFATFFNLGKSDWDEGWGWTESDPTWAFPKMLNAAFLLDRGIHDLPFTDYQTWQSKVILPSTASVTDLTASASAAIISDLRVVIPVRNTGAFTLRALMHYRRRITTDGFTPWTVEDVRQEVVNQSLVPEDIASDVVPVQGPLGRLYFFGRHPYGDLVVYWKDGYSQYSPWTVFKLASGPPTYWGSGLAPPVAVTRLEGDSGEVIHVFMRDGNGHLRRHWKTKLGFWQSEDVTTILAGQSASATSGYELSSEPPFAFAGRDLLVFGRGASGSPVVYRYGSTTEFETRRVCFNLGFGTVCVPVPVFSTRVKWNFYSLPASFVLASDRGLSVRQDGARWHLFGINGAFGHRGELIHFIGTVGGTWSVENITTQSNIGTSYRITGKVVTTPDHHVYGRNDNGEVVHYQWSAANGWTAENLTTAYPNIGATFAMQSGPWNEGTLAWAGGAGDSQQLYALNAAGDLMRYFWYPGDTWRAQNVTTLSGGAKLVSAPRVSFGIEGTAIYGISVQQFNAGTNIGNQLVRYSGTLSRGWHSNRDYSNWAAGSLHDFEYEPSRGDELIQCFGDNIACSLACLICDRHVEIWCPGFNDEGPGERAGTMLHEATHVIFSGPTGGWPHQNGKDDWYHHFLLEYGLGALTADNQHLHSMYQIQVEFLADLAEFPADAIPLSVTNGARARAQLYLGTRFKNPVGWTIGVPRPIQ